MYLDRDELMLLSRGGRVPRAQRPRPVVLAPKRVTPGRLVTLLHGLRARSRRPELDLHTYLELEFSVEEDPRAGLSRR